MSPVDKCTACSHPDLRTPKTFPNGYRVRRYLTRDHFVLATVVGAEGRGLLQVRHDTGAVWVADSRHCTEIDNPPLARDHPYGVRHG